MLVVCLFLAPSVVCMENNEKPLAKSNKSKFDKAIASYHSKKNKDEQRKNAPLVDVAPEVAPYFNNKKLEPLTSESWKTLIKKEGHKEGVYFLAQAVFVTRAGQTVTESYDARTFNQSYFNECWRDRQDQVGPTVIKQKLNEESLRAFAEKGCKLKEEPKKHHRLQAITYFKVHPLVFFQTFQPEVIQAVATLKLYKDIQNNN